MILGNSSGKNRGKKYLSKSEYQHMDELFALQALEFNKWFSENYDNISVELTKKGIYDADIINDTYIKIHDSLLFKGSEIKDFRAYFFRAFYSNLINEKMKKNNFNELTANMSKEDDPEELREKLETDIKIDRLKNDILKFVQNHFTPQEVSIFEMYVNLKPYVNYELIAEQISIKSYLVQRTISKIKKSIKTQDEFINRRKEIIG